MKFQVIYLDFQTSYIEFEKKNIKNISLIFVFVWRIQVNYLDFDAHTKYNHSILEIYNSFFVIFVWSDPW